MYIYSPEVLGVAASFITALLSLIPALGSSSMRRNILAIVVLTAAVFLSSEFEFTTWSVFLNAFAKAAFTALLAYKMFIQNFVLRPAQNQIEKNRVNN